MDWFFVIISGFAVMSFGYWKKSVFAGVFMWALLNIINTWI